jgi:uncharacterized repeat protein (TIGR01451 family)
MIVYTGYPVTGRFSINKEDSMEIALRKKVRRLFLYMIVLSLTTVLFGCATKQTTKQTTTETIQEPNVGLVEETTEETIAGEETSISWAGYTPEVMDKMHVTEVAFPTGNKKTSAVLLHEVMPDEVLKGAVYTYEYHITNLTKLTHQDVMITNEGGHNLLVVDSTPPVKKAADGSFEWIIGELAPQETKIVRVKATSAEVGSASDCVSVDYANSLCAVTKVVDPDLLLIKTAKSDGNICDDFWFTYEVVNPGSGMANNIKIRDEIPKGLRTIDGNKTVVEIAAGDLAPGERRKFTVEAKGVETGRHRSIAVAKADGGLISESENIETLIYQPVLTIGADSRDSQYLGRSVEHFYTVKNVGDAPSENTTLSIDLPGGGAQFLQASNGGVADGGKATWQLGSLGINESNKVSVKMKATAVETIRSTASANGECAAPVSDNTLTEVIGISAILLELVDSGDPAEVGNIVTYTITATNQGSAADTDVNILCTIPAGMEYVSTDGPTPGALNGNTLKLEPVTVLGVGQNAQWNIQVRAQKVGDVRFGVSMTTGQLKEKVQETEATTIY